MLSSRAARKRERERNKATQKSPIVTPFLPGAVYPFRLDRVSCIYGFAKARRSATGQSHRKPPNGMMPVTGTYGTTRTPCASAGGVMITFPQTSRLLIAGGRCRYGEGKQVPVRMKVDRWSDSWKWAQICISPALLVWDALFAENYLRMTTRVCNAFVTQPMLPFCGNTNLFECAHIDYSYVRCVVCSAFIILRSKINYKIEYVYQFYFWLISL